MDDAHDREDLPLLVQHAATNRDTVTLFIALRPYGLDRMRAAAEKYTLGQGAFTVSYVSPMSVKEATQLAFSVLEELGASAEAAPDIARLTYDCPLATVVSAQLLAKQGLTSAHAAQAR